MNDYTLAITLVLFASFFQGTFGLGMKNIAPLKWEAWWLIQSLVAMIIVPVAWALFVIPDLFQVIQQTPSYTLFIAAFYGLLWGIGGILFGISVEKTGISITYGIVMGLAASVGSIIPLFQIEGAFEQPSFPIILAGVILLLIGVGITAVAGVKRDQLHTKNSSSNKSIKIGVLIAVTSGILSASLNVGFIKAGPVSSLAIESYNASTQNASLASWVVVLIGGFIMNGGYALFLLIKNNSWSSYKVRNSKKAYFWAVLTGIFWFAALGVYGQGAALMGNLGPVIGWPILLGLALIISNIWAYHAGEWNNAREPFKILLGGLAVLIGAICLLGYANY